MLYLLLHNHRITENKVTFIYRLFAAADSITIPLNPLSSSKQQTIVLLRDSFSLFNEKQDFEASNF